MGYFLNNNSFIPLEFVIPNSDLINVVSGDNIPIYQVTGNLPGFIPIGGYIQYINGTTNFEINSSSIQIVGNSVLLSYDSNAVNLVISPNQAYMLLNGYNAITNQYTLPENFKRIQVNFTGDYVAGNGDLLICLFGKYINT